MTIEIVQDQVMAVLRQALGASVTVRTYGGEFSEAEINATSYDCPAVFVAVLGWHPEDKGRRLSGRGTKRAYLAAFVLAKAVDREDRARAAMALAEEVADALYAWVPDAGAQPVTLGPLEEEPEVENLYSRRLDAIGQARWIVKWDQCFKATQPRVPVPTYPLTAVEIHDTVAGGASDAASDETEAINVTEEIVFNEVPPAT